MTNPPWPWMSGHASGTANCTLAAPVTRIELSYGDPVQALVAGTVHITGTVVEVHPCFDIVWVVDTIGQRHLIEFERYEVRRHRPADPPL